MADPEPTPEAPNDITPEELGAAFTQALHAPATFVEVPNGARPSIMVNPALVAAIVPQGDGSSTMIHFAGALAVDAPAADVLAALTDTDEPDPNP